MMKAKIIFISVISIVIAVGSSHIGLFWDNVLFAAKMGKHIFESDVFTIKIPIEFDPGHPPFIAILMAASWKIAGKSLIVSHLVMAPFIFGLIWQLNSFVNFFVKKPQYRIWALILVLADPTLLSQFVLINPEVIQLFFFFLSLNAVLRKQQILKIIGLAFLGIVTYRGMMLCAGIFLIDFALHIQNKETFRSFLSKQRIIVYSIGALPAILFVAWRLSTIGWLQSHPDSPWSELWRFVTLKEFIRNVIVLSHRFADFGRISLIIFILIAIYLKRNTLDKNVYSLLFIAILSTFVISTTSIISTNTMGHRYYIASYLAIALLSYVLLLQFKHRHVIYTILLACLILGNFIVYPKHIAQGWDASLAHLPYWGLRESAVSYMDENHIPVSQTATFFPNGTQIDNIVLNNDYRSFIPFSGQEKYVFYSNVYNLNDKELIQLERDYRLIKIFKKGQIYIEILERK